MKGKFLVLFLKYLIIDLFYIFFKFFIFFEVLRIRFIDFEYWRGKIDLGVI